MGPPGGRVVGTGRDHVGKTIFLLWLTAEHALHKRWLLPFHVAGRTCLICPKRRQCVPAHWPPPSCSKNSPCSAPFSCTELSSHLQLLTPPRPHSLETYLMCRLLPRTSPDDSKPRQSLPPLPCCASSQGLAAEHGNHAVIGFEGWKSPYKGPRPPAVSQAWLKSSPPCHRLH